MFKNLLYLVVLNILCLPTLGMEEAESGESFLPLTAKHMQFQSLFDVAYGYLDFCVHSEANFKK